MKTLSVAGYVAMAAAFVVMFLRHEVLSPSPVVIALQAVAVVLMVWARLTFGMRSFHASANTTEGGLVTHGPYRFVRNPIYASIVLFVFAGAAANLSVEAGALALVVLAGVLVRVHTEERFLRAQYPEYAEYAARTPRLIPFVF